MYSPKFFAVAWEMDVARTLEARHTMLNVDNNERTDMLKLDCTTPNTTFFKFSQVNYSEI